MGRDIILAIAGMPNSGKTTMFNALTGARHRVGNYPGVTVEKREGTVSHNGAKITAVDLPGTYSLTAYSQEELVARDFLVGERPDVVIDVVNAATLDRSLYLAVQFLELGVPVVLALNMMDELNKLGRRIDSSLLSRLLGVPVVETVARTGSGKKELVEQAVSHAKEHGGFIQPLHISYGPEIDGILDQMANLIEQERFLLAQYPARWLALKYLEKDEQILQLGRTRPEVGRRLEELSNSFAAHCRTTLGDEPESVIADYRHGFVAGIMRQGVVSQDTQARRIALSDRLDLVLTHRVAGPAIMLGVFYGMFQLTFSLGKFPMQLLEAFFGWLGDTAASVIPEGMLQSLVISGIIDGAGGVLGFVPLVMIMFFMLTILEDSGYMARMAYMLDRVMRLFGLHGCSVMPFIVSGGIPGGCAVPGVMAARTLRSPREKIATILTAPFMTCGAKVPVFILLTGAFFAGSSAMALFLITLGGWAMALLAARLLRGTVVRGPATPFVMELPPYRLPTLRGVCIHTGERVWQYIKKAGTVILAISVVLWAAMTFPRLPQPDLDVFQARRDAAAAQAASLPDKSAAEEAILSIDAEQAQAALRYSLAGRIGTAIEPVSRFAGFDWRTNIALVGGFAAKEVIVSSLGTAYSLGDVNPDETEGLADRLRRDPGWSPLTALSLIIFVLLYTPCFVTVVVIARESSWQWAAFSVVFNTAIAFGLATAVFQAGKLIAVPV